MLINKCRTYKGTRTRAAIVFIVGFWMLDLANNTVQVCTLKNLLQLEHNKFFELSHYLQSLDF